MYERIFILVLIAIIGSIAGCDSAADSKTNPNLIVPSVKAGRGAKVKAPPGAIRKNPQLRPPCGIEKPSISRINFARLGETAIGHVGKPFVFECQYAHC